jgi:hypothetical protein
MEVTKLGSGQVSGTTQVAGLKRSSFLQDADDHADIDSDQ